jgi:hypothetical protein
VESTSLPHGDSGRKIAFGFRCRSFSVVLSSNGVVVPGESDQPLRKSLIPGCAIAEMAGDYTLRVSSGESVVCDLPVTVTWVLHRSQTEPFLGIKSDDPGELRASLAAYEETSLDLKFVPR